MSKRKTEMYEGLDAFARFRSAMKQIVSVPKSAVMEEKSKGEKRAKPSRADRVSRDREPKT